MTTNYHIYYSNFVKNVLVRFSWYYISLSRCIFLFIISI